MYDRLEIEKAAIVLYASVEPVEPKKNLRIKPAWNALGLPLRSAFRKAILDLLDEPLPMSSNDQRIHEELEKERAEHVGLRGLMPEFREDDE